MNLDHLSIDCHCNCIKKWAQRKKQETGILYPLSKSIWYILVGFDNSSLYGPYYFNKDHEFLQSIFMDDYERLDKNLNKKNMILGICYYDYSSRKSMFDYYQQEKFRMYLGRREEESFLLKNWIKEITTHITIQIASITTIVIKMI